MFESLTLHHTPESHPDTRTPDPHQDTFSKTLLGFWIYLMTDCLVFAVLFTTYAVLHDQTVGGPSGKELFHLSTAFIESMLLLFSSITCGLGVLSAVKSASYQTVFWLGVTFLLGASFVSIELREFFELIEAGNGWSRSAFLSSFFALVGTHGLHVSFGLVWAAVMMGQVIGFGITLETFRRLVTFSLFWHFLDLVWIFIFTFVYLTPLGSPV